MIEINSKSGRKRHWLKVAKQIVLVPVKIKVVLVSKGYLFLYGKPS